MAYTATNNLNDLVETSPPATGTVAADLGPAELETRRTFKAVILKEHNADGTHASVNGAVIVAGSIAGAALANGSITATQMAALSVSAAAIQAQAVTAVQIADGAITATQVADKSLTPAKLASTTPASILVAQTGGGYAEVALSGGATISASGVLTLSAGLTSQAIAVFADVETSGTDGGTFTTGAWRTRNLNSALFNSGSLWTLAANALTCTTAGVYYVKARAPGYKVDLHQLRLWDITNAAVLLDGSSSCSPNGSTAQTDSFVEGVVTIATGGTLNMQLQHNCATTEATDGFGKNAGFGDNCIFASITIIKLA